MATLCIIIIGYVKAQCTKLDVLLCLFAPWEGPLCLVTMNIHDVNNSAFDPETPLTEFKFSKTDIWRGHDRKVGDALGHYLKKLFSMILIAVSEGKGNVSQMHLESVIFSSSSSNGAWGTVRICTLFLGCFALILFQGRPSNIFRAPLLWG